MIERMKAYIDTVLANESGRHGKLEKLKVERHLRDLENPALKFDVEKAKRGVSIVECLKLTEDKYQGELLKLEPHQVFYFASIFGWLRKDTETGEWKRRFRKSYKSIARKNGKTSESAALQVYMWKFDGTNAAQCYSVANTRKQALICYENARDMVKQLRTDSKYVAAETKVMAQKVIDTSDRSTMEAMASDPKKLDGFNPSMVSVDEYHEMKNNKIIKIFESGMGARAEPIVLITTTAGFNKAYPCYSYEQMCIRILKGEVIDDTVFVDIYKMDEGDDIEIENNWYKPNPMLGKIISIDNFRVAYNAAKNEGASSIVDFRTKNLNEWSDSATTFIPAHIYKENVKPTDYKGRCMMGFDLSYTKDISALVLTFENGSVLLRFYCPEDKVKDQDNKDEVDYLKFKERGDIITTPGNVIDYEYIESDIAALNKQYKPDGIIYDKRFSTQLVLNCIKKGVSRKKFHEMYQGENQYSEVVNRLEKKFNNREYRMPDNEVMEWMFRNVKVLISERGGKRFTKENSRAKIDGVQAMAMAERGFIFIPKKARPNVIRL